MPRPRRKTLTRRQGYSHGEIQHIMTKYVNARGFGKDYPYEMLEEKYREIEEIEIPRYVARMPGHRPYAWWMWSAPSGLRPLDFDPEYDSDDELPRRHPMLNRHTHESQRDYLERNGLLEPGEVEALKRMDAKQQTPTIETDDDQLF
ncbi:MAG: hypothetical protein HQ515_02910 [Phycisphaeraceae bacterium]|nr:hypothetical protein [Phycisphaeraceae bacterium]